MIVEFPINKLRVLHDRASRELDRRMNARNTIEYAAHNQYAMKFLSSIERLLTREYPLTYKQIKTLCQYANENFNTYLPASVHIRYKHMQKNPDAYKKEVVGGS